MKAILYSKPLGPNEAYIIGHGWNIHTLEDVLTQEEVRNALVDYMMDGYEVQLIDYQVHHNNIYKNDNLLHDAALYIVENFYSTKPTNVEKYGSESDEDHDPVKEKESEAYIKTEIASVRLIDFY